MSVGVCYDDPLAQRRRVAWRATWSALGLECVLLIFIWGSFYLYSGSGQIGNTSTPAPEKLDVDTQRRHILSPIGWISAAAAAMIFGVSEVPIKIPGSQDIGPTLFNAYTFLGNGLCHTVFLLVLIASGQTLRWQWHAVGAAFNIMLVQALARSAIWLLGISVAPPMWCVVGMATSFSWGVLIFGDLPGSIPLSLVGLFFLMLGVVCVSGASILSHREMSEAAKRDQDPTHGGKGNREVETEDIALTTVIGHETQERDVEGEIALSSVPPTEPPETSTPQRSESDHHASALLRGFLYALGAGIADGSLVAYYQQMERINREHGIVDAVGVDAFRAIFDYLGTFGIVMIAISGIQLFAIRMTAAGCTGCLRLCIDECTIEKSVPGLISGALWAGANSCSVLASHFLGMSLSFPLTQTASVICALLGMFVFNELQGRRARGAFCVALCLITVGAACLAIFGKPHQT